MKHIALTHDEAIALRALAPLITAETVRELASLHGIEPAIEYAHALRQLFARLES